MRVLYKGVGEAPNRVELPNSLRALQASVGGRIEMHSFSTCAAIVCNAEGAVNGMLYNCTFLGQDWYGPVLIVGAKGEELCSIPEDSFVFLEAMVGREWKKPDPVERVGLKKTNGKELSARSL